MLRLSEEELDWLSGHIPDAERSPKGGRPLTNKRQVIAGGFLGASMRRQSRGFEDSSSASFVFCGGGIGLPSGLGVLVHVLIRRLPQRRNVAISISRSLVEPLHPNRNRSESSVLSWGSRVPPERLPRRAVRGLGAQSPHQTSSSHRRKRFVELTGFPERQQQNSELSGNNSNNGPLPGLSGAVLGEP